MGKKLKRTATKIILFFLSAVITAFTLCATTFAFDEEDETMPEEYREFADSIYDGVGDKLSDKVYSSNVESVRDAAAEASSPQSIINMLVSIFGNAITENIPRLALLLGIVMISALAYTLSSSFGAGMGKAIDLCARLCTYCAISGIAVSSLSSLKEYFSNLFSAVAAFLPLSATLYAMGGNFSAAISSSSSLSVILTVCQFICSYTVIPFFCICLSLTLTSAFDGVFAASGSSVSGALKKWYVTALSFIMMVLTSSLAAQSIIAAKADGVAMKGAKFAASSFIPVSGGAVSSTLGTLASSIEMLRGSVGVIGVVAVLLMLLPVIVELAVMRLVCSISEFAAGMLSCGGEQRLLSEIGGLYGFLEGVAVLCSVIFIIAFAIFASVAAPF